MSYHPIICSDCLLTQQFCRCPVPPYQTPLEGMEDIIEAGEAMLRLRIRSSDRRLFAAERELERDEARMFAELDWFLTEASEQ